MDLDNQEKSKRPKDLAIVQQRMWGYQPVFTLKLGVIVMVIVGTLFLILGIVLTSLAIS